MKSLIYKIKCFKSGTIKSIFNIVEKIHNKTHKCRLFLFIDIVYCSIKYGAGPYDYQEFEFYNLNSKERKTYLTRVKNNAIVRMFNDKEIAKKYNVANSNITYYCQKVNNFIRKDKKMNALFVELYELIKESINDKDRDDEMTGKMVTYNDTNIDE